MPVSPLDGPPFRGRHAAALTRIVGTVRSVLDPDSVEMEYLFEPSGQRFRWRALRSRVFTSGSLRPARRSTAALESLAVEFHLAGLLRGALTLHRRPRRPWTQPEVLRFEVFRPLLAQLLESAAAAEIHAAARRRLESAAEAASTPILLVRPSGSVLYANRAAGALLTARGPLAVVPRDGREISLSTWIARLAAGAAAGEKWCAVLADGRALEASVARFADEEEDDVAVLTLKVQSALSLEDVRERLATRGVSGREADVVGAVLEGLRNAEIARRLFITEWTVKDHLKHVFSKLGVGSRSGLLKALDAAPRSTVKPQPVESPGRRHLKM
ncbi:MAG TPA: helix-turn-helix transcriptional regulator [Thermoanaerobaculia bacterium]|nr:helix-turn-helix transcriptional regulator [Thermoanaerobaculia bacterium]